eukprot:6552016-Ditylum_brightwellii.AAC.1
MPDTAKIPSDIPYTQLTHIAIDNKPKHHCSEPPPPTPRSPTMLDSAPPQRQPKPSNTLKKIPPPDILYTMYKHQLSPQTTLSPQLKKPLHALPRSTPQIS